MNQRWFRISQKNKGLPFACHYEGMVWIPMIYRAKGDKQSCLDHIGVIKSSLSTGSGLIKGQGKVKGKLCSTCTYIHICIFHYIHTLCSLYLQDLYLYILYVYCMYMYKLIFIYRYVERDLYLFVVAMGDGFNHVTAYSCLPPCLKGYPRT